MPRFNTKSIFASATKFARGILSSAQKMFNSSVKDGNYDLKKRIEESEFVRDDSAARSAAQDWLRKYMQNKDVQFKKRQMEAGKLYFFRYIKPKHMDTLDYWDKGPLVLCLGGYWSAENQYIEVGLNLHLLPPKIRQQVLIKVFDMFRQRYRGEMYAPTQRPLELNWQAIARPLLQYGAAFAFRSYIPHLRSQAIEFKYEDWDKAIFVPNEYLNKTTAMELRNMWADFTRNRALNQLSSSNLENLLSGNGQRR
ncbi:hypothetical protein MA9V1_147 [Chryseobacterium phage MA9V-1]|nr:hypothetical protein MA9V1_147 [Chryseobacterium phage MA9V-1]